tara:strand:- start:275 stop:886 length:612 start_codon:yes stop_codon:yes gene_type:complete
MLPLEYFLFLQIILFLFITPGTPRIVIVSYSMNYGVKNCVWTALGDVSANIIQATLIIFFIESFFSDYPIILKLFKWVGVIYLCYLAFDIYNSKPKDLAKNKIKKTLFSFYRDGFIVAGTSPKAWLFFPFIFPQFIDFNSNYFFQFLILITTYVILDFVSLIVYAILANKLVVWLKTNPKIINTISACVIIIIAIIISFTQNF